MQLLQLQLQLQQLLQLQLQLQQQLQQQTTTLCLKKFRTPVICSNNYNKSRPMLIIFGTKYRHLIFVY